MKKRRAKKKNTTSVYNIFHRVIYDQSLMALYRTGPAARVIFLKNESLTIPEKCFSQFRRPRANKKKGKKSHFKEKIVRSTENCVEFRKRNFLPIYIRENGVERRVR